MYWIIEIIDLGNSLINIIAIWLIDDDTRSRIFWVECNIVVHKHNDVLILESTFLQYLICMTYISLHICHNDRTLLTLINYLITKMYMYVCANGYTNNDINDKANIILLVVKEIYD